MSTYALNVHLKHSLIADLLYELFQLAPVEVASVDRSSAFKVLICEYD